CQQGNSKPLTF
nr:immunoglobulin light chain junction region [Macaca mulatta]MOX08139.1 immunoglobulin light chain junction region [Macaca mulatta]MOX10086.1 immunoglobulin light chain junction region [Macaca mulatta]MOX48177.1 immunoglobulin light chain junction region [Macaca mulatta]MOX48339.1 immunoglobulin light chain junction region [Macaca mulatta]